MPRTHTPKAKTGLRLTPGVPGKKGPSLVVVDLGSEPPSRSAKLKTRAAWGATMVQRLRDGQRCTKRDLDLALKWVKEAVEALP